MKNSISKKALSAFLAIMMIFATMAGMFTFSASAETISGTWIDDGNYDLSWITGTTTAPASNADNYVSIVKDNTTYYYQVLGYSADETNVFYIDNAAELAGLSKLTNIGTNIKSYRRNPYFSNCTFYITGTIELANHYWIPIAVNSDHGTTGNACCIFGGNLIGSAGDSTTAIEHGTGGVITIDGMNINYTASEWTGKKWVAGLVGLQSGGSIKNITLTNAVIASNNSKDNTCFGAGSFVGRQWGTITDSTGEVDWKQDGYWNSAENCAERCTTTYENLTSDAVITTSNSATNTGVTNAAGGIVGVVNSGWYTQVATFNNCDFTGSITTVGKNAGGIVGCSETGGQDGGKPVYIDFINCDVTASISITAGTAVCGLIGLTKSIIEADNCHVSSEITAGNTTYAGGMIGREDGSYAPATGKTTMVFNNCSFTGTGVAAWFVCSANYTQMVSLTGCAVGDNAKASQATPWLGSITADNTFEGITVTDNTSPILTKYYDGATSVPAINDANETTIKDLGIQMSNDGTKMRVSAQIFGKEYDKAGFEFYVTYTVDGVVKSSKINAKDVSTCYTSIKAGDETIYADSGYYYIVFVIDGFDSATMSDISIGFAASVTKDATVTWSDSAYCDATVEVTQPG